MAIGAQQVALAQTHTEVARQEELISRTQLEHAQATVEFLAHKFTNAELYAWMSGVLGGAYNYFLQQATAMAQQAQNQLAFERQESPPAFIKADYWEAIEDASPPAGGQNTPDRQGLTGSVRLLQDITRLDQFAFDTNRRKLQVAQTFSLARLFPAEFQRFRGDRRAPVRHADGAVRPALPRALPAHGQARRGVGRRAGAAGPRPQRHLDRVRHLPGGDRR